MKENVNEFLGISPGEETKTEKCVQNTNLVNPRDKAEHTLIKCSETCIDCRNFSNNILFVYHCLGKESRILFRLFFRKVYI